MATWPLNSEQNNETCVLPIVTSESTCDSSKTVLEKPLWNHDTRCILSDCSFALFNFLKLLYDSTCTMVLVPGNAAINQTDYSLSVVIP